MRGSGTPGGASGLRSWLASVLPGLPAPPAADDWPGRRRFDTDWQRRLYDAVAHVSQPFVVYDAGDRAVAYNQAFNDLHGNPGGTLSQGYGFVNFLNGAGAQPRGGQIVARFQF